LVKLGRKHSQKERSLEEKGDRGQFKENFEIGSNNEVRTVASQLHEGDQSGGVKRGGSDSRVDASGETKEH